MLELTGPLANLKGKFGDFTTRKIGNKTFLVKLPVFKEKEPDAKEIFKREKYTVCLKLTHAFNKIPGLRFSFERITMSPLKRGPLFSYLFKEIKGLDCSSVQLLPASNFVFSIKEFESTAKGFSITTNALAGDTGINPAKETNISLYGSLVLFKEADKPRDKFQCIPAASITQKSSLNHELSFELGLSPLQQAFLSESKQAFLLMVLVTSDSNGNTTKNSNTVCINISN